MDVDQVLNNKIQHEFTFTRNNPLNGIQLQFDKNGYLKSKHLKWKSSQLLDTTYFLHRTKNQLDSIQKWYSKEYRNTKKRLLINEPNNVSFRNQILSLSQTEIYEIPNRAEIIRKEFDSKKNWRLKLLKMPTNDTIIIERSIEYY
jgi:hypothetical protein